jgi:UDP-GlcNAc:undecaprenyl-phosphate GlcNAc-1-phosphate transferase
MTMILPLAALGIPMLDVLLAISRRLRVGQIFRADKAHIHHTMLALGMSQRVISLIVYFITVLFGLIAIGFSFTDKKILFSLLMVLLALIVVIAYIIMRLEQKK